MLDPDQLRRAIRIYRAASVASKAHTGYKKTKRMLDDQREQNDVLMDAAEFVGRVRDKQVRPEDIRTGGRLIVRAAPKIYRAIARHIQAHKAEAANAKA